MNVGRKLAFKPRARLLLLLGDQLIRDSGIALFELVKNGYDADSPSVDVLLSRVDRPTEGQIVVEDAGTGMTPDVVTGVWLEPGTDFRVAQKNQLERTPKYKRIPIGEKGVGRFAAHKLGKKVRLITRSRKHPEVVVDIDWERDFEGKRYLEDVAITVLEREPVHFTGSRTGTRIEISHLRETWTRGMVRDASRAINAICSPFGAPGEFRARLLLTDHQDWVEGLLTVRDVLKFSVYRAKCLLRGSQLLYDYEFTPFQAMNRVKRRRIRRTLTLGSAKARIDLQEHHVGPVELRLHIFDLDAKVLQLGHVVDKKGLKDFLGQSGGVRVYRGGIRVYDYGERGNDWLGLGGRRVNVPTKRISNNQLIGVVALDPIESIDLEAGRGLIEKTNREGFVENADYEAFRDAVAYAVQNIEVERNFDKRRIRNAYFAKAQESVLDDLTELREVVEKKDLTDELGSYLDRIEADYTSIRERLLASATTGLSLSVVIHEVEKGVAELVLAVNADRATNRVKALAKHLADLVEGYASLVRTTGTQKERASALVSKALFNLQLRLSVHKIALVKDVKRDFDVRCSRRLIISSIMNLIDNSIFWLDTKWGDVANKKRLYVGTTTNLLGDPAIIVADNGPGFVDPPEYLIEPFVTRKPEGMGLGLHIASEVMKAQGGELLFPDTDDVSVPDGFDGAIVALSFRKTTA